VRLEVWKEVGSNDIYMVEVKDISAATLLLIILQNVKLDTMLIQMS